MDKVLFFFVSTSLVSTNVCSMPSPSLPGLCCAEYYKELIPVQIQVIALVTFKNARFLFYFFNGQIHYFLKLPFFLCLLQSHSCKRYSLLSLLYTLQLIKKKERKKEKAFRAILQLLQKNKLPLVMNGLMLHIHSHIAVNRYTLQPCVVHTSY